MANVHYLTDLHGSSGKPPPDYVLPIWDDYLAFHKARSASHAHQQLHGSHYSHLDADEARFVTPELIKSFCIAGQPDEIAEQLHALEADGLDAIAFIPPSEQRYAQYESFARRVIPAMRA